MKGRILVLGSSNMDLILRIPRFHRPGETIIGKDLATAFGGKGANQAVAAGRLGGKVLFLTKLGKDSFGESYRRYLIQNGFSPRLLLRTSDLPTGVALIEVVPGGENRIIVSPGANGALSAGDLRRRGKIWKGTTVFLTQLETPLEAVSLGLRLARDKGALTILNPAPAAPLAPEVYPLVDYLVPNEGEAQALSGMEGKTEKNLSRIAKRFLDRGVGNVVITLGARGLFFKNGEREIRMEAFRVKAVDTTAAGDAFLGALACGLAAGKPIPDVLRWANAAGALAVTKLGAQPSLPQRKELEKFLGEVPGALQPP